MNSEAREKLQHREEELFMSEMAKANRRIDAFYRAKPFDPQKTITDWIEKDVKRLINGETTNHVTRPRLNIIRNWANAYLLWNAYCDGICTAITEHNKKMLVTGGPFRPIQMESFPSW